MASPEHNRTIAALSAEKDIEVEISEQIDDFDAVVDATESAGKGEET